MSQLSGLNQSQQISSTTNTSELSATKATSGKASVNIANNLQGVFQLQGTSSPVTQQLTMAQAQQLAQQPLMQILSQQTALIFLQSQNITSSLNLPTNLVSIAQQWLKSDKNLSGKLPNALANFIAENIGISTDKLQNQLMTASLKQMLLQLNFLQGEPIVELKLPTSATQQAKEQLEQLLQFMLPIPAEDNASLLVQEQSAEQGISQDDKLRFRLQFDLSDLGKLEVQVELKDFELSTVCICNSALLQRKVERLWPQLESRLTSLGFEMSNQIKQKTRLDDNSSKDKLPGLINIKV